MTEFVRELFVRHTDFKVIKVKMSKSPKLDVSVVDAQWVQVLSEGWATPLTGFMREEQYLQCLHFATINNGKAHSQSIPIVLAVSTEDKIRLENSNSIAVVYDGREIALLENPEFYEHR